MRPLSSDKDANVLYAFREITEHRRVEDELRLLEAQLRERCSRADDLICSRVRRGTVGANFYGLDPLSAAAVRNKTARRTNPQVLKFSGTQQLP